MSQPIDPHKIVIFSGAGISAESGLPTCSPNLIYDIGGKPIQLGDTCEAGSQLRPHIVWFGEDILNFDRAKQEIKTAGKVLVVGTSLTVYPAASLLKKARFHAEKILVSLEIDRKPFGYTCWRESASYAVPRIVTRWLQQIDRRSG